MCQNKMPLTQYSELAFGTYMLSLCLNYMYNLHVSQAFKTGKAAHIRKLIGAFDKC